MKYLSLLPMLTFAFAGIQSASAQDNKVLLREDSKEPSLYERVAGDKAKQLKSHMNFNFCTTEHTDFNDWDFAESKFKIRRMRWEIYGDFAPNFSYHYRQSFNGEQNLSAQDNILSSIEMAFINWKPSPKVDLMFGRQFMCVSGYECWVNGVDVREFSDFNDYFNPCRVGVTANFHINDNQMFGIQAVNSMPDNADKLFKNMPEGYEKSKAPLMAGTQWIGHFADKALMLQYSALFGKMSKNKNIFYFTGGNVWQKGPILAYLDFMYSREGIDTKGLISEISSSLGEDEEKPETENTDPIATSWAKPTTAQNVQYFTTIANVDYRFHPHWNMFVKGAYEIAGVYKDNGTTINPQEPLYKKGLYKRTWNAQLCFEYIPMPEKDNLRFYLHMMYKNYNYSALAKRMGVHNNDMQRITLGLVYTIPVF